MTRINVTEEDIEWGVEEDARNCALAIALERHVPEGIAVSVTHQFANFINRAEGVTVAVHLPRRAMKFVKRYDEGSPVTPRGFNISLPEFALQEAE